MNIKEQKLEITGMTCGHCVMTVEKTLKNVPGVQKASVSLEEKNAIVTYDADMVKPAELVSAVNKTNYKATLA